MLKSQLNNLSSEDYNLNKPQEEIIKILDHLNIKYIDLLPELRKANINNTFYWELDGHFNEKGYTKASEIIFSDLNILLN